MRFLTFSLPKSGEVPIFAFIMGQYYGEEFVFAYVLFGFEHGQSLGSVYDMVAVHELGHIPARHTFRSLFRCTAESRVWLIRLWGEECHSLP